MFQCTAHCNTQYFVEKLLCNETPASNSLKNMLFDSTSEWRVICSKSTWENEIQFFSTKRSKTINSNEATETKSVYPTELSTNSWNPWSRQTNEQIRKYKRTSSECRKVIWKARKWLLSWLRKFYSCIESYAEKVGIPIWRVTCRHRKEIYGETYYVWTKRPVPSVK